MSLAFLYFAFFKILVILVKLSAYGIVRILLNEGWSLPIKDVLPELIQLLSGKTAAKLPKDAEAENEIADFIRDRVKQQLQVE